jgi:RNA polymerase sigma-32 factor
VEDGGRSLLDRLSNGGGSPEDQVAETEEREQLRAAVARMVAALPARERELVERRLLAEEPATLEELGASWNVSKERVRQIEEQTRARLRVRLAQVAPEAARRAREEGDGRGRVRGRRAERDEEPPSGVRRAAPLEPGPR